ncbi:MAG: hotdog fold thioesterase [Anaerolineales bacterium]|jgi:acyl-CoA thioesterase
MNQGQPTANDLASQVAEYMSQRDLFAQKLGIKLEVLHPGYSRVSMKLTPDMANGLGLPHGAVIFALADFAFATACNSHGQTAVALSMDIHFIASPDPLSRLEAEATEVHCGKRTGLYKMVVRTEEGLLVAELHGMAYRKKDTFLQPKDHEA